MTGSSAFNPRGFRHSATRLALALLTVVALTGGCRSTGGSMELNRAHGVIDVATTQPGTDLYRVVLQQVDGKGVAGTGSKNIPPHASIMIVKPGFNLIDAQRTFILLPGKHVLEFTAIIDEREASTFLTPFPTSPKGTGRLEITVAEGKRYYVAARIDKARPDEWEIVVYKIEDIQNYQPRG